MTYIKEARFILYKLKSWSKSGLKYESCWLINTAAVRRIKQRPFAACIITSRGQAAGPVATITMGNPICDGFWFFYYKTTKAIAIKLSIISFGTNSRIAAKFQIHRFRTFGENRGEKEKKYRNPRGVNHIRSAAATLRSAVAGGVNKKNYRKYIRKRYLKTWK